MPRLMSVTLTEQAVVERRKTVTRRLGWFKTKKGVRILQPGDRLTLCRKVMGRNRRCAACDGTQRWRGLPCGPCAGTGRITDPVVHLAEVEVASVRREQLWCITADEVVREGVDPALFDERDDETGQPTPDAWVRWFCAEMGVTPDTEVTRIEWRYLDVAAERLELANR